MSILSALRSLFVPVDPWEDVEPDDWGETPYDDEPAWPQDVIDAIEADDAYWRERNAELYDSCPCPDENWM